MLTLGCLALHDLGYLKLILFPLASIGVLCPATVCLVRAASPRVSASLLGPSGSDAGHLGPWGSEGSGPWGAGGHLGPTHEVDSFRPDGFQCLLGTAPQAC